MAHRVRARAARERAAHLAGAAPCVACGGARDRRDTTPGERVENYRTTVGLEPEQTSQCVQSAGDCSLLMISLEPLDVSGAGVRHKGGPVLRNSENDDGWMCLQTWLAGSVDPSRCQKAVDLR